mmetsp:Transcript_37344/g.87104  ORF Transcript_37344/g.87104 Transcript_37344/m.87104 type:complete len:137 (-) Transcript_37344:319-729(-)
MRMVDESGEAAAPPSWFRALVWAEVIFQLPFFVAASSVLCRYGGKAGSIGDRSSPPWFRSVCIIYGVHTATTLIPIFASILDPPPEVPVSTLSERAVLASFYLPYFLFPAYLVIIAMCHEQDMFGDRSTDRKMKNT